MLAEQGAALEREVMQLLRQRSEDADLHHLLLEHRHAQPVPSYIHSGSAAA